VIGAGWGRTGTLSLNFALETLGYPCHHMFEVESHHDTIYVGLRGDLDVDDDWREMVLDVVGALPHECLNAYGP